MTVSQSSVTFFLALLALLAHFTDRIRSSAISFRDWVSGTNFSMNAGLVDADYDRLTVILDSRRNYAFAVSSATCIFHLPVDWRNYWGFRRKLNDAAWLDADPPAREKLQWVGPFLLAYELEKPEFFEPFETRMITFEHKFTGFPSTEITQSSEEPKSYCSVAGADQHNTWASTALITDPLNLDDLDALVILQRQTELDKNSGEEELRIRLIDDINEVRGQSNTEQGG